MWIALGIDVLYMLFLGWSMCVVAGRADDQADRLMESLKAAARVAPKETGDERD